jgi:hypothetical protein
MNFSVRGLKCPPSVKMRIAVSIEEAVKVKVVEEKKNNEQIECF